MTNMDALFTEDVARHWLEPLPASFPAVGQALLEFRDGGARWRVTPLLVDGSLGPSVVLSGDEMLVFDERRRSLSH